MWIAIGCIDVSYQNHAFSIFVKSLPTQTHEEVKKWIFEDEFPENWFEFDII